MVFLENQELCLIIFVLFSLGVNLLTTVSYKLLLFVFLPSLKKFDSKERKQAHLFECFMVFLEN